MVSFKPKMLTFAALQMQPNQRHHQRPVLRLLMSQLPLLLLLLLLSPLVVCTFLPDLPACLLARNLFQPSCCCCGSGGGRFYQTASRQMRYLFLVWLITSCLPVHARSLLPPCNTRRLCLCPCHPSIDCHIASCASPLLF